MSDAKSVVISMWLEFPETRDKRGTFSFLIHAFPNMKYADAKAIVDWALAEIKNYD